MDLAALTAEVLERCDILAGFSEEPGRITRRFLTPPMRDVHRCLTEWMNEAGLQVRCDALGNLIGRRPARAANAKIFVVGSHVDTVPNAGRYDGVLGVLLGVAALKALKGRTFNRAVDVIAFSEEEGVRFATPYLGSRAVCGCFDAELLDKVDADGITLLQALRDFGLDPTAIASAAYAKGQVAGYFEAHIEQGPILESYNAPLAVVDGIVGQSRRWLTFIGKSGHAGTVPMGMRSDALVRAAKFICQVDRIAPKIPGLRATVGRLSVEPGVVNVIPGVVRLSLDVRHADDAVRKESLTTLINQAQDLTIEEQAGLDEEIILDQDAVPADSEMTGRLAQTLKDAGQPVWILNSGAGHDAAIMAGICPMTMLFVRSISGVSHHPDENVFRDDVQLALQTMIRFLEAELERETA